MRGGPLPLVMRPPLWCRCGSSTTRAGPAKCTRVPPGLARRGHRRNTPPPPNQAAVEAQPFLPLAAFDAHPRPLCREGHPITRVSVPTALDTHICHHSLLLTFDQSIVQVTVAPKADIIGKTVRETGFRGRFDAAVIAVKRNNVKQGGRLGDVVLQKGDILVLSAGENFDAKKDDFTANFKK